jgi:hypothetical protein
VLIDSGKAYVDSNSVLRSASKLGGAFRLVVPLLLLPRALRDPLYRVFARNRYRWFGMLDQCRVPTCAPASWTGTDSSRYRAHAERDLGAAYRSLGFQRVGDFKITLLR